MSTVVTSQQTRPRRWQWYKIKNAITPYLFLAPFLVIMLTFNLYVFIKGAQSSFTDAQGINPGSWIGLQNYSRCLSQDTFWIALKCNFKFLFGCWITQIPVAFVLAVILNGITKRLKGILRAAFFVPVLINSVLVAIIFRELFNKDTGWINWFLGLVGLPNGTDWIHNSTFTIPLLVIVAFWQWTGFHMVYYLASLQAIDPTIYEVAKLDGASRTRTLLQITVPLCRPAFVFTLITSAIGSLMLFELPFLIFDNLSYGPGGKARTLLAFIYDYGFSRNFELGFACAIGWLTFFVILIFSGFQLKVLGLGQAED